MRVICLPAAGIGIYLLQASDSDFLMANIWNPMPPKRIPFRYTFPFNLCGSVSRVKTSKKITENRSLTISWEKER